MEVESSFKGSDWEYLARFWGQQMVKMGVLARFQFHLDLSPLG